MLEIVDLDSTLVDRQKVGTPGGPGRDINSMKTKNDVLTRFWVFLDMFCPSYRYHLSHVKYSSSSSAVAKGIILYSCITLGVARNSNVTGQ